MVVLGGVLFLVSEVPLYDHSALTALAPPAVPAPHAKFKLPWREASPPNHHDDKVDSDQYRAYSSRRSHNRRSHTVKCDVDLNCSRSHTTPPNADLNHLRSHGAPQNADLNTAEKKWSLQCLPPQRMELANFRIEKPVNISPEKLSSRVVQLQKNHVHSVHVHEQPPIKNKKSSEIAIQTVP